MLSAKSGDMDYAQSTLMLKFVAGNVAYNKSIYERPDTSQDPSDAIDGDIRYRDSLSGTGDQ